PPFKSVEFDIMYGFGISKEGDVLDMATDLELSFGKKVPHHDGSVPTRVGVRYRNESATKTHIRLIRQPVPFGIRLVLPSFRIVS
ncbi:MAG: hypothetical protein PHH28_08620, partial [Desulfuromonadaceae bacterium]|nr:hypothetical protein [Desulfuromonadaceae bacterium]